MKLPARRAVHSEVFFVKWKRIPQTVYPGGNLLLFRRQSKISLCKEPQNGSYLMGRKKLFLPESLSQDISGHKTFDLL